MPEGALKAVAPTGRVFLQPDGNCLYRAVEDQLDGAGLGAAAVEEDAGGDAAAPLPRHEQLRAAAVDYMRSHEEEFAPFVLPVCPFPLRNISWQGCAEMRHPGLQPSLGHTLMVQAVSDLNTKSMICFSPCICLWPS